MIIDAHVHLPVGKEINSLQQQKEQLLQELKRNHVSQCIVISDSCLESSIGSMDECVELFKETANVAVVGGISPFLEYETQLIKLKNYLNKKEVVGIKLFTGHEAFYLTDKSIEMVYELAIQYGVPVLFHSGWNNSQYSDVMLVAEIARKYPEMKLVCCHCFFPELEKCMHLMEFKNIIFDLSSVADDVSNRVRTAEIVKRIIDLVPERVVFGSDFSCCNQKGHLEFIKELKLAKNIEDNIFWKNAKAIYSL